MRRIVFALIATFSALLLAATIAPAATAQQDFTVTTERTAADRTSERVLPFHDVRRLRAFEIGDRGKFRVVGKAITYRGKQVILKKSNRKVGGYKFYKADRAARDTGRFSINFDGKFGTHFRLFLKRTPRYRATTFYLGKIVRD
jgi:hypothetical protein